jgi:cysteinyl-tRNA synthetase
MRLFNTLGRQLQEFKPINDNEVRLYTCGPTVYDYTQLGNLRSFVFDDTLRRALEFVGYNVKHVMNITDVGHLASDMDEGEDKLEKGAAREGRTVWEIADSYIRSFKQDIVELNVLPPNGYSSNEDNYARATAFIPQQVELVQQLTDKGFAYQTEQAIYFDVSKLDDYGELSGQKLSDKEVGVRREVVSDPAKRNPQDFALWFFLTGRFANHSMHWPSPWGEGFPGWHLECSAIIHATLNDPIDIHTGGVDHIGTHHTNEMAQTEAAYGHKLANFWLHNEFLLVDNQRMGKSLGNFYTLKDIKERGFSPLALRLLFLQSHYRSQLNFTWQSLEAAGQNLASLTAWADLIHQDKLPVIENNASNSLLDEIKAGLEEDLNTARGLAAINEVVDKAAPTNELLQELDRVFGLKLSGRPDITGEQKQIVAEREEARKASEWQRADEIRKQLEEQGIGIKDTPAGPVWYRV